MSLSLHQNGECFKSGTLPSYAANDTHESSEKKTVFVNVSHIKEGLQRTHLLYDRNGEEHYNIISAMHKSIRGGDENAALYWLARMLVGGEDPLYVARRLVRCASEDIGKCLLVSLIIELEDYVSYREYLYWCINRHLSWLVVNISVAIFVESRSRLKETRMVISCYSLLVDSWLSLCRSITDISLTIIVDQLLVNVMADTPVGCCLTCQSTVLWHVSRHIDCLSTDCCLTLL